MRRHLQAQLATTTCLRVTAGRKGSNGGQRTPATAFSAVSCPHLRLTSSRSSSESSSSSSSRPLSFTDSAARSSRPLSLLAPYFADDELILRNRWAVSSSKGGFTAFAESFTPDSESDNQRGATLLADRQQETILPSSDALLSRRKPSLGLAVRFWTKKCRCHDCGAPKRPRKTMS
jgi:hypothetical protein